MTGKVLLRLTEVELVKAVANYLAEVYPEMEGKGVVFVFEADYRFPWGLKNYRATVHEKVANDK